MWHPVCGTHTRTCTRTGTVPSVRGLSRCCSGIPQLNTEGHPVCDTHTRTRTYSSTGTVPRVRGLSRCCSIPHLNTLRVTQYVTPTLIHVHVQVQSLDGERIVVAGSASAEHSEGYPPSMWHPYSYMYTYRYSP